MFLSRTLAVLVVAVGLVSACGSDDDAAPADTTAAATSASTGNNAGPTTTEPAATTAPASTPATSAPSSAPPTTAATALEQPAIWPAASVIYPTPEEAAESFVADVLDVAVNLGPFQQGDARSGEMEVLFAGEGGSANPPIVRGLLLLRQLGPDDGWFVTAAVNDNAAITSPRCCPGSEVEAGPLPVEGVARGFEGAVVITAYDPADPDNPLDQVLTQGGAQAAPAPFAETVDLSGAEPGSTVVLLVRGGVGLETDPGDFGAIPLVIAS